MSCNSFFHQMLEAFLIGGAGVAIGYATAYLFDKIKQHDNEIEELFSRLEECESSQDNELKK